MRTAVIAYTGFFTTMMLVAIVTSITSYSSYTELNSRKLDDAIELSVKMLQNDREYQFDGAGSVVKEYFQSTKVTDSNGNELYDTTVENAVELANNKFKNDFLSYMTSNINSSDIKSLEVNFYGVDAVNGLLSVEVIADFYYPSGNVGRVSTYKTVILDKYVK